MGKGATMRTLVKTHQWCAFFFLILPMLMLLSLSGCVDVGRYAAAAKEATKEAKNVEAGILEDAPCLIGLGAWSRMDNPRKRDGVFYLCVPDSDQYGVKLN